MKNLFIPYELALLAKEKGFNYPCLGFYTLSTDPPELIQFKMDEDWGCKRNRDLTSHESIFISAPLFEQIFDWF